MNRQHVIEEIATMLCGERECKCSNCGAHGFCTQEDMAYRIYDKFFPKQSEIMTDKQQIEEITKILDSDCKGVPDTVCQENSCSSCKAHQIFGIGYRKQREREWISVEERLPDSNTAVIVATVDGIVFQCLFAYDGWDLWETNRVHITHWMPLPEAPKGGDE